MDAISEFAAPADQSTGSKATYTPTHALVKDGNVSLQAVKRDTDNVPFVAITRTIKRDGADTEKVTYDRADRVARYLQLLAEAGNK